MALCTTKPIAARAAAFTIHPAGPAPAFTAETTARRPNPGQCEGVPIDHRLPLSTGCFLSTDIEGSTTLWERDRSAMAAAVDRHLALLRAAVEANGGVLFKVVGCAVQTAFPTAPRAVAADLAGQQALLAADWWFQCAQARLTNIRRDIHYSNVTQ